jgi:hypothetical protein
VVRRRSQGGLKTRLWSISRRGILPVGQIANSNEFDREWLDELRPDVPTVQDIEVAKGFVLGQSKGSFLLDQVRHYKYPWMLRATGDAYANGNLWERARLDSPRFGAPVESDRFPAGWISIPGLGHGGGANRA